VFREQQKPAWVRTLSIIIEPSRSMHFLAAVRYFPIFLPALNMLMLFSYHTAEDVLADLGMRQAMRSMPKNARL
jgi:hypothetical protein